jgi:hypothetical protein
MFKTKIFDTVKNKVSETSSSAVNLVSNSGEMMKSVVVKQAIGVNYKTVSLALTKTKVPIPSSLNHGIEVIKNAADMYNKSVSKNKEDEFISYLVENLDAKHILNDITPIVKIIPFGSIIVYLLRFIIRKK